MERFIISAILAGMQSAIVLGLLFHYKILGAEHKGRNRMIGYSILIFLPAFGLNCHIYGKDGFSMLQMADHFFIFSLLVLLAVIDTRFYKIPNRFLAFGGLVRIFLLIISWISGAEGWLAESVYFLISMAVCLFVMLMLSFLSKRGIGYGDVKLFALLGFWFGIQKTYFILFYSILLAAIAGLVLMGTKRGNRKTKLPFAPFVLAGYCAVFLMM